MLLNTYDTKLVNRIKNFTDIATELSLLSNKHLSAVLETATPLGASIGGTASLLTLGNTKIFVKKICLTDIERQSENMMSTANIFNLPLGCQYGIGSPGFGAWRELAAHTMSTHWIISGDCPNFPICYHWRILERSYSEPPSTEQLAELERDVNFWERSAAVRERLLANLKATADIVLFLEYFPENLHNWLKKQIALEGDVAEAACTMVENNLNAITAFINSRGLIHSDAHFMNVLTDGHCLYLTDFGLATSNRFELSKSESDFFEKHYNYDRCYTMAYFVEWLLTELFGAENWFTGKYNTVLQEYASGNGRPLLPKIEKIVMRYLPVAIIMNEFFIKLKDCKSTPYPFRELEKNKHCLKQ
ncbi:MAG: serine/threonine protein kinase [Gammaproteobacteria bacterium]|nr:serine/threonine protein kinase [Gammaproteobacteria bacterium]